MKLTYRPEIDGIRAVAVGSVVLYHAQLNLSGQKLFTGGFIGVDIFFVISGYLITSIILKELISTGTFSFKNFYQRRVRRILPALLLVMLVSLPFAWIYLQPKSLIDFSKSILFSLGFSSNIYFQYSGEQYGAASGFLKPFLHTWSLSVEEQFYIIFPIILIISFKYLRRYLIQILIITFFISFGLANLESINRPSISFYYIHTRMWELLIGSILAYYEIKIGHRSTNKTLNVFLPGLGLLLICHSILFFNDKMFHPSLYTLSPILGVCLIIWFSSKGELITKIISSKLFVGIGLISYSLYLWHYPIFAFVKVNEFVSGDLIKKLLLIPVVLILSILSYYCIERPARNKKLNFTFISVFIITSVILLFSFNVNMILNQGYDSRLPEILKKKPEVNRQYLKNLKGEFCHDTLEGCKFNTSSNKKVYIIGDSHMEGLSFDLMKKLINKDYQFIKYTMASCGYFPGFDKTKKSKVDKKCNAKYFLKLKNDLLKENNAIIILGGRFPVYLSNSLFNNQEGGIEGGEWSQKYVSISKYKSIQDSFKNEVLEISKNNKIILIYPIPEVGWDPYLKIWNNRNNFKVSDTATSFDVFKKRTRSTFDLFDSISNENIFRVFPHALFCNTIIKDRCITHDGKENFYRDDDHPSIIGAEMINDLIMEEIRKIESN